MKPLRYFIGLFLAVILCANASIGLAQQNPITNQSLKIAIAGDSTVANYKGTEVLRGWGQLLPEFFKPDVKIDNFAKNGRSTKTFISEQLWQMTLDDKPDIILIQFGHNDSHTPASQHPEATQADGDFMDNLRKMIVDTRAAGITPVLVTPMHRRTFGPDGKITSELMPYADAMKRVGAELKAPVIDLQAMSGDLFQKLGEANSSGYTPKDRTHFGEKGARVIAYLVATGAADVDARLKAAEISPLPKPELTLIAKAKPEAATSGMSSTLDSTIKTEVAPK